MYVCCSLRRMGTTSPKCSISLSSSALCALKRSSFHRYSSSTRFSTPPMRSAFQSLSTLRAASSWHGLRWTSKLQMIIETASMIHCGSRTTSSRTSGTSGRSYQQTAPSEWK